MFQADIQTQERTFQIEDGKKKMMIIFTSFLFTIPQRWHSVCWLSSSLFRVFVYFLLLQVSASDRNWFPVLQLCVYSILRFSFTQFIASVRCVEWANCYFWVIIAAMFVCLGERDDLWLASAQSSKCPEPGTAVVFFCRPCSTSAISLHSAERKNFLSSVKSLHNSLFIPQCETAGLFIEVVLVTMSDSNHLLWDEVATL